MKRMTLVISLAVVFVFCAGSSMAFFEPDELLQWDQKEKLTGSVSLRYYPINDQPVQLGRSIESNPNYLSRADVRLQYRLWEGKGSKVEFYVGSAFLTHVDVFDRLHFAYEFGYTFKEKVRLSLGHFNALNIGLENIPNRGISATWVNASGKIYQSDNLLLSGYGKYYWSSKIPSRIGSKFGAGDDGDVSGDILKIETGLQALAKSRNFEFFLVPYAYLGDSSKVERIGSYGGARYDVRPLLKNLLPVKLEIAGNYNTNIDLERNEEQLWLRIILELK
ncbi:MAG: hypothetical protein Q8N61_00825 [bacterium]|nr:hypothetical protein [bacterium]